MASDDGKLTHLDDAGRAQMVSVAIKPETYRMARAVGRVHMAKETLEAILAGKQKKGEVFALARVSAINAIKKTSDLIPLCHPIRVVGTNVDLVPRQDEPVVDIAVTVEAVDRTGVEMEALTGVSVAALTIYDMVKAIDRDVYVAGIGLAEKTGGRSGHYLRPAAVP